MSAKNTKISGFITLHLILCGTLFAHVTPAQDTGLTFLRIGVNAAAGAMGDAQVAAASDAFATYWNPAGLAEASSGLAVSHRLWIGDVRAYDVAARLPSGHRGAWGLAVTATDSGNLEAREQPGDATGTFKAQFISVSASYARIIGPLRAGLSAKYLRERIYEADASGFAFDAGLQLDLPRRLVTLGVALRNTGSMSELQGRATRLPQTLAAGAALHPLRIVANQDGASLLDLEVTAEVSHVLPGNITRVHTGIGVTILDLATVRAGHISNDALRTFTFGLGLYWEKLIFDYAYIPFKTGFEGPGHVLSLSYAW